MSIRLLSPSERQNRDVYDAEFRESRGDTFFVVGIACRQFVLSNFTKDGTRLRPLAGILEQPVFRRMKDERVTINVSIVDPSSSYVMTRAREENGGDRNRHRERAIRNDIMTVIDWIRQVAVQYRRASNGNGHLKGTLSVRLVARIDQAVFLTSTRLFLGHLPIGRRADNVPQIHIESDGTVNNPDHNFIEHVRHSEELRRLPNYDARDLFEWGPKGMHFVTPYDGVFVSYNRTESSILEHVVPRLEQEGVGVTWDRDFAQQAGPWLEWVERELTSANVVCVFVRNQLGPNQQLELDFFNKHCRKTQKLLPIFLGNESRQSIAQFSELQYQTIGLHPTNKEIKTLAETIKGLIVDQN